MKCHCAIMFWTRGKRRIGSNSADTSSDLLPRRDAQNTIMLMRAANSKVSAALDDFQKKVKAEKVRTSIVTNLTRPSLNKTEQAQRVDDKG